MLRKLVLFFVCSIVFFVFPISSFANGNFTASNVHYNVPTNELTFDGSGFASGTAWYDSIGISKCNDENFCASDAGEFWGPEDYFKNYTQFPLITSQHFSGFLFFNSYRPSSGIVYLMVKTNVNGRNYSQPLNYDDIVTNLSPTPTPTLSPTIYFSDKFLNYINGETTEQINPNAYFSKSGYFYDISDFTYDNTNGLWSNPNQSAGVGLKGSSFNQNFYCAGETLLRNPADNHTYPTLQLNATGYNGYVYNFDMNWSTGLIQELSMYKPSNGQYLISRNGIPFNTSTNIHWVEACNDHGTMSMYLDGIFMGGAYDGAFSGGNAAFNLFYAPLSHITNWAITNGLTVSFPEFNLISLSVPLLKQTDPQWGSQIYDSANKWSPQHLTIGDWGCALTSAAMVLKYYKVDKLPNGTLLDPGSLNTWLKSQPDGYVGNGLINWLAISRLTKQAKPQNSNFSYDALEYRRKNGYDASQLTTDLQANQPDILEEPGHFVVGKGKDPSTFTINDPYFDRQDLNNSAYQNKFLSLGRYIPSHTDLSYLMFTVPSDFDITVTSPSGQQAGGSIDTPFTGIPDAAYYLQQGTTNPNTGETSDSLKILTVPTPTDGNYTVSITNTNPSSQKFALKVYSYDSDGNVLTNTLEGNTKSGTSASFTIPYQNTSRTRGNLTCDPSELKGDNSTLHKLLCDVVHFFTQN